MIPVTAVRLYPHPSTGDPKRQALLAFASIELAGSLVIRDCKLLRVDGRTWVETPESPYHDLCPRCEMRAPVTSLFCGRCGQRLRGRPLRRFQSVAFPTCHEQREEIERAVIAAYEASQAESSEPVLSGQAVAP